MTERTAVSVLMAAAGPFHAAGRPVIALNSTITKLQTTAESLVKRPMSTEHRKVSPAEGYLRLPKSMMAG